MIKKETTSQVYFVDQASEGDHHMVYNASIIRALMLPYPGVSIHWCGIATNQQSTKQLRSPEELKRTVFTTIHNPKVKSDSKLMKGLNYIRKEFIRLSMFRNILKQTGGNDLIFLSIATFTAFALFKFIKQFYPAKVIAVLHGDIDFIYFPTGRMERINAAVHKWIFKKKLPGFRYLLLNKTAKKTLVKDGYLNENEVYEIDHPFTFLKNDFALRPVKDVRPLKLGHIGNMEVECKNSHYIYELAANFRKEIDKRKIQFRVAGLITPGVLKYKNKWVHEVVGNQDPDKPQYLTRSEYECELSLLDYCIFFYLQHQYVYRASDAVVDLINGLIPVITLRHPFDYLFKVGGNIGFICDSLNDMEVLLKKMTKGDQAILGQYTEQQKNIQLLQEQFSVDAIAKDLKHQMALYL